MTRNEQAHKMQKDNLSASCVVRIEKWKEALILESYAAVHPHKRGSERSHVLYELCCCRGRGKR